MPKDVGYGNQRMKETPKKKKPTKKPPKTLRIKEPEKKLKSEESKPKKKPKTLRIKEPEKPKKKMPKTLRIKEPEKPKKKVPKTLRIKEPPKPEKKKKSFSKGDQVLYKGRPHIVTGGGEGRYDLKIIYPDYEHKTEFDHEKQIEYEKFVGTNHYIYRPERADSDHRDVSVFRLKKMKNPVKFGRIIKGSSGAFGFPKDFDIFKLGSYKTIHEMAPDYIYT